MNEDKDSEFVMVRNEFFDTWIPRLTGPETKVAALLLRKIFGASKVEEEVSARKISVGAGMGRHAVFDALAGLVRKQFLERLRQIGKPTSYKIIGIQPVQKSAQVPSAPVQESTRVNGQPVRNPARVSPEPVQKSAQVRTRVEKLLKKPKSSLLLQYPKAVDRMRELADLYGASVDTLLDRVLKRCVGHSDDGLQCLAHFLC